MFECPDLNSFFMESSLNVTDIADVGLEADGSIVHLTDLVQDVRQHGGAKPPRISFAVMSETGFLVRITAFGNHVTNKLIKPKIILRVTHARVNRKYKNLTLTDISDVTQDTTVDRASF